MQSRLSSDSLNVPNPESMNQDPQPPILADEAGCSIIDGAAN
jgi:hypothetical protein